MGGTVLAGGVEPERNRERALAHFKRDCPACSSSNRRVIGELPVTHSGEFSQSIFRLVECDCSLIYLTPLPTESDFAQLYQASTQFDSPEYVDERRVVIVLEYMANCLRSLIEGRYSGNRALKILEVGAGLAWMCRAAKEMGLEVETVAQDVTTECREKCPWVDRYIADSVDAEPFDALKPFDLISATHVFEHVPDPVNFLGRLRRLIKPSGIVFLTMPHRPHLWDGSIEGWSQYTYNHVPAHLQYFSRSSLEAVARKAGFHVRHWDASHEDGQALEAHLVPSDRIAEDSP